MNIDKPDDALLLLAYHGRGGQCALIVTLAYTVERDGRTVPEHEVWPWLLTHFTEQPFDMGFKKERGVFGVAGSAHAASGQPVAAMAVRARVGALQKTLHVHGDRHWDRQAVWRISPARPFVSMPVTLSRAFGGAGWPENPQGRGWFAGSEPTPGLALPNIELPDAPIVTPHDRPAVASFSVLPGAAPSRMAWLGRFDDTWQRERFPWVPDDTDPRWFDAVPSDQGMDAFWQGNETWEVHGMHPERPAVSGKLPGFRPRLLVRRQPAGGRNAQTDATSLISEVRLDLDTVWLFPNEQRVMVMYRAAIPVSSEDAADVAALGLFTEVQTQAATPAAVLAQNWLARDEARLLDEQTVATAPLPGPGPESTANATAVSAAFAQASAAVQQALDEGARQGNEVVADIEARIRAQTGTAMSLPRLEAPTLAVAPSSTAEDSAIEALRSVDIDAALQQGQADMEAIVREIAQQAGQDPDQWVRDMRAVQAMPTSSADSDLVQSIEALDIPGMPEEIRDDLVARAQSLRNELDTLSALPAGAAAAAQHSGTTPEQEAEPGLEAEPEAGLASQVLGRDEVLQRIAQGASLARAILTDLDLAGLSLAGVDFSHAVITQCSFSGADLSAAVLDHARLDNCDFTQASLEGASLRQTDMVSTVFAQARCARARLIGASLSRCDLSGSDWSDATLDGASLGESVLDRACFAAATMAATNLWAVRGQGVSFREARLAGLRLDSRCDLPIADFDKADLQNSSLQDSDLQAASFNEALLDNALVRNCVLDGSVGWQASAVRTDFKGSSWTGARWPAANFMTASFAGAHLENVDFSGANLHACEVRTAVVRGMQVQGALLTRCDLLAQHAQGGHSGPGEAI